MDFNFVHFVQFHPFHPLSWTFYKKVDKITTLQNHELSQEGIQRITTALENAKHRHRLPCIGVDSEGLYILCPVKYFPSATDVWEKKATPKMCSMFLYDLSHKVKGEGAITLIGQKILK